MQFIRKRLLIFGHLYSFILDFLAFSPLLLGIFFKYHLNTMLYKCNYGFDCILTGHHVFPTRVPNSLHPTSSAGTRLSISPNRWVTGTARLRLLSEPVLCCIAQTPTVTRAWKHRETKFLHSVHQRCYHRQSAWSFFSLHRF